MVAGSVAGPATPMAKKARKPPKTYVEPGAFRFPIIEEAPVPPVL